MSLRTEYHELVDTDIEHAWNWYDYHERGLGDRFLDAIDAAMLRASIWPNAGAPVLRNGEDEIIEQIAPRPRLPVRCALLDRG